MTLNEYVCGACGREFVSPQLSEYDSKDSVCPYCNAGSMNQMAPRFQSTDTGHSVCGIGLYGGGRGS